MHELKNIYLLRSRDKLITPPQISVSTLRYMLFFLSYFMEQIFITQSEFDI